MSTSNLADQPSALPSHARVPAAGTLQSPSAMCEVPIWMFPKIGYPQIIHLNRVFHKKQSILGYPYFWRHPYWYLQWQLQAQHCRLLGQNFHRCSDLPKVRITPITKCNDNIAWRTNPQLPQLEWFVRLGVSFPIPWRFGEFSILTHVGNQMHNQHCWLGRFSESQRSSPPSADAFRQCAPRSLFCDAAACWVFWCIKIWNWCI